MPRKCIVPGCETNKHFYEHGVRFFSFPPEECVEERERWRELVGRGPEWRIPGLSCVCQRHFGPGELPAERKLPVGVFPSVNLPGFLEKGDDSDGDSEPSRKKQRVQKLLHIEIVAEELEQITCRLCGKNSARSDELMLDVLRKSGRVRDEIWALCWTDDGGSEREQMCDECWNKLVDFEIFVDLCRHLQDEPFVKEELLESEDVGGQLEQVLIIEPVEDQGSDEVDDLPQLAGLTLEQMIEELEKIPPGKVKSSVNSIDHECWDCGESFPNISQKKEHRKHCELKGKPESLKNRSFECEICKKKINTRAGYRNHLVKLHSETLEACKDNCPKELIRLQSRKRLKCPLCQSQFHHLYMLKYHLRTHQIKQQNEIDGPKIKVKDRDSTCKVCGKTFVYPPYLDQHMKFHLKVRDFPCDLCDKAFYLKQDLQNHRNAVHLEHTFLCGVCGKSFGNKKYLDRHHRKLHEAPKEELKCTYCSKQMNCAVALRYHVMTHTKEKNHRCETCGSAFRMRYELTQHRIRVHQEHIEGVKLYKQQVKPKKGRRETAMKGGEEMKQDD